jgi:predicted neuraminidase
VHMEFTPDAGATWERTPALNDGGKLGLIQPTILKWPSGRIQILCRSRQGWICESAMGADWKHWSAFRPLAAPNPNSGIDGWVLRDGRGLLVYNPVKSGRTPLSVGLSADGESWREVLKLEDEPGEYSYPAIIQSSDGRVHITYTWRRLRIKHVVVDPDPL